MTPDTQVSLGQSGLCDQRREQCARGNQCYESSGGRLQPGDSSGCHQEFENGTEKLADLVRQMTQALRGMTSLSHVRCQPALEIPVAQLGNFFEKRDSKPNLKLPPESCANGEARYLEQEEHNAEQQNGSGAPGALPCKPE